MAIESKIGHVGRRATLRRLVFAFAFGCALAAPAKTTRWIASGGGSLNDPANWDNGVPGAGDTANVWVNGSGCAFTNESADFAITQFFFTNTVDNTLYADVCGETMSVETILSECNLNVYAPVRSVDAFRPASRVPQRIFFRNSVTPGGDLILCSLSNDGRAEWGSQFLGPVVVTNGTVSNNQNSGATFKGSLTANRLNVGVYWTGSMLYFAYGAVKVADWAMDSGTLTFDTANILDPSTVIKWDMTDFYSHGVKSIVGKYEIQASQVIDRIHCDVLPLNAGGDWYDAYMVGSYRDVTLTLAASASDLAYCKFYCGNGNANIFSLAYAPKGDYTQVFSNRVHTMTGSITVKGGTLKFNGNTSLKGVPTINVPAGTFAIDTPVANPLAALTSLAVGTNAAFKASGFTGQLGASTLASCTIDEGGKLHLPSGVTLSATFLLAYGVTPVAGIYTGVGYGTASATECDWIVGGGQVTVDNAGYTSWKAPVSGNWSDATKWTHGLPTRSLKTYIAAQGADYTVTANGELTPEYLFLRNGRSNRTTLSVNRFYLTNCWFTVGRGGFVDIPTGGYFNYSGMDASGTRIASAAVEPMYGPFMIVDGGAVRVSGGTLDLSPWCSYVFIGSYEGTPGSLEVIGGCLRLRRHNVLDRIVVAKNGKLDFSDSAVFDAADTHSGWEPIVGITGKGAEHGIVFRDGATVADGMARAFTGQGDMSFLVSSEIFPSVKNSLAIAPYYNGGQGYQVTETQKVVVDLTNTTMSVGSDVTQIGGGNFSGGVYDEIDITGIFNIWDGATFTMDASRTFFNYMLPGLAIGYGAFGYFQASYKQTTGKVNVHPGGSFINQHGYSSVGVCRATGFLTVDGGDFQHQSATSPFTVGLCGGTGTCEVVGGTFTVAGPAYLGGIETNKLIMGEYLFKYGWTGYRHDAVGTFRQEGGDVTFEKPLTLGVDGTGTLEMDGKTGSFTAQSMVFSNSVLNAEAGGTVKFTLDAKGVRPISLTDRLVLGRNAKLVVDASAYPVHGRTVKLFDCAGGIEGKFSEVELTGAFAEKALLEYRENEINLRGLSGLTFFFW